MTIFRGYLKGALRQRAVIILYLVIFLGLGTLMTMSLDEKPDNSYDAANITMAVIDRDNSAISKRLVQDLKETQDVKDLEDSQEVLQEELYYGNIEYVLVIPEGFQQKLTDAVAASDGAEENTSDFDGLLEGTGRPGSVQSHYASEVVESYLSGIRLYLTAGYSPEDAVEHMANLDSSGVVTGMAEGSNSMSKVAGTFRYLPYVLSALACYVIGFVMLDYQQEDIRLRLAVSAVSAKSQLFQQLLAFLVIGVAFFVVSILMVAVMNLHSILTEPNWGWYLLNVMTMAIVALSIAFLVVHLARSGNGINGLANVIALGMSFICGVFIPDSMLSETVKQISVFLPVYWYEQNNDMIGTHSVLSASMQSRLILGYERQLLFAAVVLIIVLVVRKVQKK